MKKKPVILITHKTDPDTVGFGVGQIYRIRSNYCWGVLRAGGVPILTAMGDEDVYDQLTDIADGIILSGGGCDINPVTYRDKNRKCSGINDEMDRMEFHLFESAVKKGIPVLGICRGIQVINVAMGGTLIQDIPEEVENLTVHKEVYDRNTCNHPVIAKPDTLFAKLFGEQFITNSHHHQAVKECGKGLIPSVTTEEGVIEAIEHESLPIFGTQWHPERMIGDENFGATNMMPLFEHFVSLCKK